MVNHDSSLMAKAAPSDSGYGDDGASVKTADSSHPLARKGYEVGTAADLAIGDVFEFLWADAHEFQWEWKCLGYNRFIVLRHSDTFPHHCACIPITTGSKHDFAKPGIDTSQQGFMFDDNRGYEPSESRLPYSPVGIELKPGKLRVKEDSRANYADIVEIDHDAQVMIVGSVSRNFDRVRRNTNKAFMRNILKKALEEYRAGRAGGHIQRPDSASEEQQTVEYPDADSSPVENPAEAERADEKDDGGRVQKLTDDHHISQMSRSGARQAQLQPLVSSRSSTPKSTTSHTQSLPSESCLSLPRRSSGSSKTSGGSKKSKPPVVETAYSHRGASGDRQATPRPSESSSLPRSRSGGSKQAQLQPVVSTPSSGDNRGSVDYDLRSMHDVAMARIK